MNRCRLQLRRLTQNLLNCSYSQPSAVCRSYPPPLTLLPSPWGFGILSEPFPSSEQTSDADDGVSERPNTTDWDLAGVTPRKCMEVLYRETELRRFCHRIWAPRSRRGVI